MIFINPEIYLYPKSHFKISIIWHTRLRICMPTHTWKAQPKLATLPWLPTLPSLVEPTTQNHSLPPRSIHAPTPHSYKYKHPVHHPFHSTLYYHHLPLQNHQQWRDSQGSLLSYWWRCWFLMPTPTAPSPPWKWTKTTKGGRRGAARWGPTRRLAAAFSTSRSRAEMCCRCVESRTRGGEKGKSSMSAAESWGMWMSSAGASSWSR